MGYSSEVVASSIAEYKARQGLLFYSEFFDADLDDVESITFLMTSGAKKLFIAFSIEALGPRVDVAGYESPTFSANGTEIVPLNFNRSVSSSLLTKVYNGPTVSVDGTQFIDRHILSSATGVNMVLSGVSSMIFRELKSNTSYIFRISPTGDNTVLSGIVFLFEEA
jgi:hypothetical protein